MEVKSSDRARQVAEGMNGISAFHGRYLTIQQGRHNSLSTETVLMEFSEEADVGEEEQAEEETEEEDQEGETISDPPSHLDIESAPSVQ